MNFYKKTDKKTLSQRLVYTLFLCILPFVSQGQDAPPSTLLPDIDPQDIEIRGDFVIRFPGIMRQPILGFNPRPRVFQIDPNRMPFIESAEQVVASLPLSDLERPSPPVFSFYQSPERFRLWGTAGIGNYMAPESDIFLGLPLGSRTQLTGRFKTLSTGSYLEEGDQTSSFRNLDGGLNLIHYSGKRSRWDFGVNGRWDRNHLNNALFVNEGEVFAPGITQLLRPDNNLHGLGSSLTYRYDRNALSFFEAGAEVSYFGSDTEYFSDNVSGEARTETSELRYNAFLRSAWATRSPGNVFSIESGFDYAGYDLNENVSDTWYIGQAGAFFSTRIGYQLKAKVGGRVFYTSDAVTGEKLFVYPEISTRFALTPDFSIHGLISGFVFNNGLEGHSQINRKLFVYQHPENERGIQFKASAEYQILSGLKAKSGISFARYSRHSYYTLTSENDATTPGFTEDASNNLLTFAYLDGANLMRWESSVWYDLVPSKLNTYMSMNLQWHTDKDGNEIPFRENFGISAGGVYSITDRARVNVWTDFVSARKISETRGNVDGYLLLNAKFDFWASRDIGAYLKITNLLNQKYPEWVGYHELPAQIFGGIMIKF